MSETPKRLLSAGLQILPILAAVPLFLMIWASYQGRVGYPFDVEWMEGGMLVHAWRMREGLPIYVPPSADWVPYIYPPLYPWLLSLLGEPSYATARTLSFAASCVAAAAAVFAVRRERAGWGFAVAAAGLFFSAYDDTGTFFDLARNDAVAIALGAWAMALSRVGTRPAVIGGGLLLFAAFTAKHNFAAVGLPILLWLWRYRGRGTALTFAASSVIPALTFLAAMQIATDGHFLTYLLEVPAGHPLVGERGWPRAEAELWSYAPFINGAAAISALMLLRDKGSTDSAGSDGEGGEESPDKVARGVLAGAAVGCLLLMGVGYAADVFDVAVTEKLALARAIVSGVIAAPTLIALLWLFYRRSRWEGARYWAGIAMVIVPLVALMRAHHGGFVNVSIPGFWLVSVLSCALVGAAARRHVGLLAVLSGLLAFQLYDARWENPERYLPTEQDAEAGEALIELIAGYEGEVLMPHFPWYPRLAGKQPSFPLIAYWDIDHKGGPYKDLGRSLDDALKEHRWDAVITPTKPVKHGLLKHYQKAGRTGVKGSAMRTRVGWRVQPTTIWEPRRDK